jgi:hypothetical protein
VGETKSIDAELEAIKTVTQVLTALDTTARQRVLKYVMEHLGMCSGVLETSAASRETDPAISNQDTIPNPAEVPAERMEAADIRALRDEKQPSSDIQMATLVAYYLAELVPDEQKKESITSKDVTKYFKQAGHPLPKEPKYTLVNARNAGYLENAGSGAYKINPVGHNLVVHNLPRSEKSVSSGKTKHASRKKPTAKKARAKKARSKKKANRSKKGE